MATTVVGDNGVFEAPARAQGECDLRRWVVVLHAGRHRHAVQLTVRAANASAALFDALGRWRAAARDTNGAWLLDRVEVFGADGLEGPRGDGAAA